MRKNAAVIPLAFILILMLLLTAATAVYAGSNFRSLHTLEELLQWYQAAPVWGGSTGTGK